MGYAMSLGSGMRAVRNPSDLEVVEAFDRMAEMGEDCVKIIMYKDGVPAVLVMDQELADTIVYPAGTKIDEEHSKTYKIVRSYADDDHPDHRKVIYTGLTLVEAHAHCRSEESRLSGVWFDGFEEES